MDPRWLEVTRKWLNEAHGPVLALDPEELPDDLRERLLVINQGNLMDVCYLISRGAPVLLHDPGRCLDAAILDKVLVVGSRK